jgi:adenylate cyclase
LPYDAADGGQVRPGKGAGLPEVQQFGYLVLADGAERPPPVPLVDRVFVGRECLGVDDTRRIVLDDDLAISRNHLEVRVDPESSQAVVVDTSSNGTRINGVRIERAVGVPLHDGDRIQVGSHVLEFRCETPVARPERAQPRGTVSVDAPTTMAMIVGDLINFSTVSEQADQAVLARDIDKLYKQLRELLSEHRGTLVDYVGDAFFASWEVEADPAAAAHALGFSLAASERVSQCTAGLELRYADGSPLRMGWAATMGTVVMRLMPGSVVMALGDAVNVGFRIASISGREGRPSILATKEVREAAGDGFSFGAPETVTVKGRVGEVTIYGVSPLRGPA